MPAAGIVRAGADVPAAELLTRASDALARAQRAAPVERARAVAELDALLEESRRRGEPRMVARLLRYAVVVRLLSEEPPEQSDPLLDELTTHARRHGLTVLLGDAHALRARRAVLAGTEETALDDAATALAVLTDPLTPDAGEDRLDWARTMAAALTDLALVLTQLGAHELADDVARRGERHAHTDTGEHLLLVHLLNRMRLLLSWGLRLERAGQPGSAGKRFSAAADLVVTAGPMVQRSPFFAPDLPSTEQAAVLGAALALARPGAEHVERLRRLEAVARFTSDRITVAIALGRCLDAVGDVDAAVTTLAELRDRLAAARTRSEPMLQLALVRELARLQDAGVPDSPATDSIRHYAAALEAEMWSLRQARIAAMRTQAEHVRLSRLHGAMAAQARSDPLTGLPNRRVLDEQLRLALAAPQVVCALALVDLDGFKEVNDLRSHAAGDAVLCAVADTVRNTLRGRDLVARYGGDEFVMLLPQTRLPAARAAVARAVRAVAALPAETGAGVTLSAGVVALHEDDTPAEVLARADATMYRAKRDGGNRVASAEPAGAGVAGSARPAP